MLGTVCPLRTGDVGRFGRIINGTKKLLKLEKKLFLFSHIFASLTKLFIMKLLPYVLYVTFNLSVFLVDCTCSGCSALPLACHILD